MVASGGRGRRRHGRSPVSIPFIAGQWSLPEGYSNYGPGARQVSIPFIAGQWSLHHARRTAGGAGASLNPLHCGAVVASSVIALPPTPDLAVSQSPSLRGSGRFLRCRSSTTPPTSVSIPFIAGQWSLLLAVIIVVGLTSGSQSPSLRGSGRFRRSTTLNPWSPSCLNPLHCGAVVASVRRNDPPPRPAHVSIPFIAGQWSLRRAREARSGGPRSSQSPSLRGSGRFGRQVRYPGRMMLCLNPLHCGAVVASQGGKYGIQGG